LGRKRPCSDASGTNARTSSATCPKPARWRGAGASRKPTRGPAPKRKPSLCGSRASSERWSLCSLTLSAGTPEGAGWRLAVEMLGDVQLAGGLSQLGAHQHVRHHEPQDIFPVAGDWCWRKTRRGPEAASACRTVGRVEHARGSLRLPPGNVHPILGEGASVS